MKSLFALAAVLGFGVLIGFGEDQGATPPELGVNASLHGRRVFPVDDLWNKDVSKEAVDPNSDALIASIGRNKALHPDFGTTYQGAPSGIPYVVVDGKQGKVPVSFEYADESDKGPYPIPADAPIEGGAAAKGDRHVLVIDRDNWVLYELFSATPVDGGKSWKAGSGAIFDLAKNTVRPAGWTSADAAGLPVFAGLARYDEVVERKEITHALRFTVVKSRRAYVAPARHWASRSDDVKLPPMGMRVRLKAGYDASRFPASAQVILTGLKRYGMIVADNGGDWFVSGAPDPRWNDGELQTLKRVKGSDFEVVEMGEATTPRNKK
ncbi:MAG: hypothetical protein JWN40_4824 [Phycisphaerales bacterium]|nr:hypothetical protein [Phycisphaerales bacterium]